MGQDACNGQNHDRKADCMQMSMPITACCLTSKMQGENFEKVFGGDISIDSLSEQAEEMQVGHKWGEVTLRRRDLSFTSTQSVDSLNYSSLTVVKGKGASKRANQTVMVVPFEVVILTTTLKLKESFLSVGRKLYRTYTHADHSKPWSLHKNGFYIRFNSQNQVAILTQNSFYQGEVLQGENGQIMPTGKGKLLTQKGMYSGHFFNGKAEGHGTFHQAKTKIKFQGDWAEGKMTKGKITTNDMSFEGKFKRGMASGPGFMELKKSKTSYKGNFKKAQFHDTAAVYETKDYVYEGSFSQGRKNGEGKLIEYPPDYKPTDSACKRPQKHIGVWQEDYYLGSNPEQYKLVNANDYKKQEEQEIKVKESQRQSKIQQQESEPQNNLHVHQSDILFINVASEKALSQSESESLSNSQAHSIVMSQRKRSEVIE